MDPTKRCLRSLALLCHRPGDPHPIRTKPPPHCKPTLTQTPATDGDSAGSQSRMHVLCPSASFFGSIFRKPTFDRTENRWSEKVTP